MEDYFKIAAPIALPVGICAVVAAVVAFVMAKQLQGRREALRKLRIAIESDPTPVQLGEAQKLWPEVLQYPQSQQRSQMIQLANKTEAKRADSAEGAMTFSRLLSALAVLCFALVVAAKIIIR